MRRSPAPEKTGGVLISLVLEEAVRCAVTMMSWDFQVSSKAQY